MVDLNLFLISRNRLLRSEIFLGLCGPSPGSYLLQSVDLHILLSWLLGTFFARPSRVN